MKLVTMKENFVRPQSSETLQAHVEYILPTGLAAWMRETSELLLENVREIEDCPQLMDKFYEYAHARPKTMLLMRHGGFGDLLMLTPIIRLLKQAHPGLQVDFGCSPRYVESLQQNKDIRHLIPTSYIPVNDALMYDAVGWFDKSIERNEFTTRAGVEVFADCLGIPKAVLDECVRAPIYECNPKHRKEVDWLIQNKHLDTNKKLIAIQVFGSAPQRGWPIAHVMATVTSLAALPNVQLLLFGQLPPNFPGLDQMKHALCFTPNVLNFVNQTQDIGMCTALLERCDLLIAPDSSFVHFAAALGIETIALYGPFPSWARGGYGWGRGGAYPKIHCIENGPEIGKPKFPCQPCYQHAGHPCMKALNESHDNSGWSPCMKAISPDIVIDKTVELLKLEKESQAIETAYRQNQINGHINREREPLPTMEFAPTMRERSVRVGIIHGGASAEQLIAQIKSMIQAKTFEGFKHIDLTVLSNGQKTAIPKTIQYPGGALNIIAVTAEENVFPPVPYNDLLAFWEHKHYQQFAGMSEQEIANRCDKKWPNRYPDWFIIMDDDLLDFKEHWLQKMITKAERLRLDCWAPEFCYFGETFRSLGMQPGFASAIIGISRDAFEQVGYFMEDTEWREGYCWHGFDSDYSARVGLAGLRSGIIPGSQSIANHLGHNASLKRGLTHTFMAVKSNDFHYRRWRSVEPPKSHLISSKTVKPRHFAELGTEGLTWTVKREPMPAPQFCDDVSVIIPTWNNADGLLKAIESVNGKVGEVIVIDDASTDHTQQALKAVLVGADRRTAEGLKIIRNDTNLGFTAAVNRGIKATNKKNHVFILNDDAEVVGDSLYELLNSLDDGIRLHDLLNSIDGGIGLVSMCHTNVMTDREECLHPATAPRSHDVARSDTEPMDWTGFCAVLISRAVIEAIGLLNEKDFPLYSSDREYCARAATAGFRTVCVPATEIYHHGSVASYKQRMMQPDVFKERADKRIENEAYIKQLAMRNMQEQMQRQQTKAKEAKEKTA